MAVASPASRGYRDCVSQGDNRTEALDNVRQAIELYIEDRRQAGDPVATEPGKEFVEVEAAEGRVAWRREFRRPEIQ
jgi:hypothetical protein